MKNDQKTNDGDEGSKQVSSLKNEMSHVNPRDEKNEKSSQGITAQGTNYTDKEGSNSAYSHKQPSQSEKDVFQDGSDPQDSNGHAKEEHKKHKHTSYIDEIHHIKEVSIETFKPTTFSSLCYSETETMPADSALRKIQLKIATIIEKSKSGHPGAAMSLCTAMYAIFKHSLFFDEIRDILVMSNGHACMVMYTFLGLMGKIDLDYLNDFRKVIHPLDHSADGTRPNDQNAVSRFLNERKQLTLSDSDDNEFLYTGDDSTNCDRIHGSEKFDTPEDPSDQEKINDGFDNNKLPVYDNDMGADIDGLRMFYKGIWSTYYTETDLRDPITDKSTTAQMKESVISDFEFNELLRVSKIGNNDYPNSLEDNNCAILDEKFVAYWKAKIKRLESDKNKKSVVFGSKKGSRFDRRTKSNKHREVYEKKDLDVENFPKSAKHTEPANQEQISSRDRYTSSNSSVENIEANNYQLKTTKSEVTANDSISEPKRVEQFEYKNEAAQNNPATKPKEREIDGDKNTYIVIDKKCAMLRIDEQQEASKNYTINKVTPGHPEYIKNMIDATTGPLGQGIANAVGHAISAKKTAGAFSKVVHCIFGDGCYQEGISHEAFSLASHLKLNNLVFYYDCNNITIDGSIRYSMSDDQIARFRSYKFDISVVNGNDLENLESLVCEKTFKIRYPNYQEQLFDENEEHRLGSAVYSETVFKISDLFYVLTLNGARILEFASGISAHLQNFRKGKYDEFIKQNMFGNSSQQEFAVRENDGGSEFFTNENYDKHAEFIKSVLNPAYLDMLMEIFTMKDLFFLAFVINLAHMNYRKIVERGFVMTNTHDGNFLIQSRLGTYKFPRKHLMRPNNAPTVIILKTKIADGTTLEGDCKTHGAPLGNDVIRKFRSKYNITDRNEDLLNEAKNLFERIQFSHIKHIKKFTTHLFCTFNPEKTSHNDMRLILRIVMDKMFVMWSCDPQKMHSYSCQCSPYMIHDLFLYSPLIPNKRQFLRSCLCSNNGKYNISNSSKICEHLSTHLNYLFHETSREESYDSEDHDYISGDFDDESEQDLHRSYINECPNHFGSSDRYRFHFLPMNLRYDEVLEDYNEIRQLRIDAAKNSPEDNIENEEVLCWLCPEDMSMGCRASTKVLNYCKMSDHKTMRNRQAVIMTFWTENMDKCSEYVATNQIDKKILNKIEFEFKEMQDTAESTRKHMQEALEVAAKHCKQLIIGSADLTPSCLTQSDYTKNIVTVERKNEEFNHRNVGCLQNGESDFHSLNGQEHNSFIKNRVCRQNSESDFHSLNDPEHNSYIENRVCRQNSESDFHSLNDPEHNSYIENRVLDQSIDTKFIGDSKSLSRDIDEIPKQKNKISESQSPVDRTISAKTHNDSTPSTERVFEAVNEECDLYIEDHKVDFSHNYIHYGIREHAMFSIANGIAYDGNYIPITSTFLNFVTYGWHGVRLSALSHLKSIFILTHDSVFLGEDGPTHQPIETIPLLRSTPHLKTLRPCNGTETRMSLLYALKRNGPTAILLSRQKLKNNCRTVFSSSLKPYVIHQNSDTGDAEITILSTGSEVSLCIETAQAMQENVRVVSVLDFHELRDFQDGLKNFVVSVEASSTQGWAKYSHYQIGIDTYGLSGNETDLGRLFGFTPTSLAARIKKKYCEWRNEGRVQLYFL